MKSNSGIGFAHSSFDFDSYLQLSPFNSYPFHFFFQFSKMNPKTLPEFQSQQGPLLFQSISKNTTITSADFHSSKGPSPEVPPEVHTISKSCKTSTQYALFLRFNPRFRRSPEGSVPTEKRRNEIIIVHYGLFLKITNTSKGPVPCVSSMQLYRVFLSSRFFFHS